MNVLLEKDSDNLFTAISPVPRTLPAHMWYSINNSYFKLPYNPAIPFLGIDPEKTLIRKDTCTPMFIAALFTIAKTWKQPKCPSRDEWVKKMWYTNH